MTIYQLFENSVQYVTDRKDVLNNINVFPIADKDTGNNISDTLKVFMDNHNSIDVVNNLFNYAKGSSGNILCLFLIGFLPSLQTDEIIDSNVFHSAFIEGLNTVENTIDNLKEGTIVSLFRICISVKNADIKEYFKELLNKCFDEWCLGKSKLPILKTYNTLDSGALGFLYILNSFNIDLNNYSIESRINEILNKLPLANGSYMDDTYRRYCLEFILDNSNLIKESLYSFGNEVICIHEGNMTKVHIHTDTPRGVLEFCKSLGTVSAVKIDDNEEIIGKNASVEKN